MLTLQNTDGYEHEKAIKAITKFTNSNGIPNNRACIRTKKIIKKFAYWIL